MRYAIAVASLAVLASCGDAATKKKIADLEKRVTTLEQSASSSPANSPSRGTGVAGFTESVERATAATQAYSNTLPNNGVIGAGADAIEVVAVDARPGDRNNVYVEYAWKVTLRNKSAVRRLASVRVKFLDSDGFELTSGGENDLPVPAGSEATFTGTRTIGTELIPRYAKPIAVVTRVE